METCMDSSDWLKSITQDQSPMDSCSRLPVTEPRLKPPYDHALKCPRCDSMHTKFCYYNNYSLSQPRYFCKNCRLYWTKGGSLRNVPVGGGYRKNKRSTSKNKQSPSHPQPLSCFQYATDLHLSFSGNYGTLQDTHYHDLANLMERMYGGPMLLGSSSFEIGSNSLFRGSRSHLFMGGSDHMGSEITDDFNGINLLNFSQPFEGQEEHNESDVKPMELNYPSWRTLKLEKDMHGSHMEGGKIKL